VVGGQQAHSRSPISRQDNAVVHSLFQRSTLKGFVDDAFNRATSSSRRFLNSLCRRF
jgi:hypothetical protein